MSDAILAPIISGVFAVLASIAGAVIVKIMEEKQKKNIKIAVLFILLGAVVTLIIYLVLHQGDVERNMIAGNNIKKFGSNDFHHWNEVVAWDTDFKNPKISPVGVQSRSDKENEIPYYEYELPVERNAWRNYTITYKKTIQTDIIMARFYLPDDPENIIVENRVGLVILEPDQPPFSPRVAQSITAVTEGEWTLVTLDLRDHNYPTGESLAGTDCELQISISLFGGPGVSDNATVKIRVADISLYGNVGELSFEYVQ